MSAIEFIENWLSKNKSKIGIQSVLYEFHSYSNTHFLKILPLKIVEGSDNDLLLSHLIFEFEDAFTGEMLCLLDSSSLTTLENPIELIKKEVAAFEGPLHNNIFFSVPSLKELEHSIEILSVNINVLSFPGASSVKLDFPKQYLYDSLIPLNENENMVAEHPIEYNSKKIDEDQYPLAA